MPSLVKQSAFATVMAGLMVASTTALPASYEDIGYSLVPAVNFSVGTSPFAVAVGDFNGDSKPDIAVANQGSNNVSVRLGTGTGSLGVATNFAAGSGPQGLATADFNGDGKLDLAVANLTSNNVSILLGTGAGTFGSASQLATGGNPRSVAVGDFNKDGKPDLAVPDGGGSLVILLGNGNGSFGAPTSVSVGSNPISAAIGDFNGDTNLDIAVANEGSNTLTILLGVGNGTFTSRATRAVGSAPRSVVTADFNGDGRKDLAVANFGSNNVSVLIGAGNGDFGAVVNFAAGAVPQAVIARDLNADGKLELIVANEADRMTVLLGTGTGSFGVPASFVTGLGVRWVEVADFNRDGHLDLVVANQRSNNVSVLLGEVLPVLKVNPSQKPNDTSSYALRRTSIWIERQEPSTGLFSHAMYADINKDGFVDFVRTHENNDGTRRPLQVMMGGPGSTFTDATATVITNTQPGLLVTRKILTADFNGDGWPDFFLLNHGLDISPAPGEYPQLFLSNGNGSLRYVPGLEGPQFTYFNHGGAAADIDGNGTVDVLVANPTNPFFLINDGTGRFTKNTNRLPLALTGTSFYTAELIDVDNDGFMDIISGAGEASGLPTTIYWGSSSGYYRGSNSTVLPPVASWGTVLDFAVEDINRDGRKDVVVNRTGSGGAADYQGRYFQILRQTAPRVFVDETGVRMSMNTSLDWIDFLRAQDINSDGAVDLVLDDKTFVAYGEYAWINNGWGVFTPYTGAVTPTIPRHSRGDFNSDAKSDVLWRNQSTGSNVIWKSANSSTLQGVQPVSLSSKIAGHGDFDGDGRADIFWRNDSSGANAIWKSGNGATSQAVASLVGSAWQVAGVGDFNGDGKGDIVWRNQSTGANMIWKSGNAATSQVMTGVTGLTWEIVGIGDFNYDGISDVLWRNRNTGANTIWKSAQSSSQQTVTGVTILAWKVGGVGDFDGDGVSDILWRNQATGANVIWKSAKASTQQPVATMADLAWKIAAVGDYDSDGKSDILWRNGTTGANVIWRNGNSAKSQAVTAVTSLAWTIAP